MTIANLYQRPVPLNQETHESIRIKDDAGYGFARPAQTVVIAGIEFSNASKEFPIIFIKNAEKYLPAVLLGLKQNQNLFIDADGAWLARYIPAFLRQYPFIVSHGTEDDPLTVWVDETAACLGCDEGEFLFHDRQPTSKMKNILDFIQDFHVQMKETERLAKLLADAGLLTERTAHVQSPDGQMFNLTGFATVDTTKLAELSPETVDGLFRSGALNMAFLHLSSLDNLNHLLSQRINNHSTGETRSASLVF